jgi:hypothetical protein
MPAVAPVRPAPDAAHPYQAPERAAYSPDRRGGGIVIVMETRSVPAPATPDAGASLGGLSPAEELPGLYRAILERVAELDGLGERAEAARIRHAATEVYSGAWDAAGRRSLLSLIARADRAIAGESQSRTWSLRRRSAAAR